MTPFPSLNRPGLDTGVKMMSLKDKKVVSVLDDPKYAEGFAFGLKGDTGITMLEGAAA
jgi:hypothetical protein